MSARQYNFDVFLVKLSGMKLSFFNNSNLSAYIVRLIISGALIAFFLSGIDEKALMAVFDRISWGLILMAFGLIVCLRMVIYCRMKLLLEVGGDKIPYKELVKVGLMGDFGNVFMPGSLGSDLFRIYILQRYLRDVTRAASAVIYERFIGLVSLAFIVFVSVIWARKILTEIGIYGLLCSLCIVLAIILFAFFIFPNTILTVFNSVFRMKNRIGHKIRLIAEAIMHYSLHKSLFFSVFAISIATQIMRILVTFLVACAIGVSVDIQYFFLLVPIIIFVLMIPVSVGGLGVREGASVFLFSFVGVGQADAFMMALLTNLLLMFYSLPGGVLFIMRGEKKQDAI